MNKATTWIKQHKALTGILALILIGIVGGVYIYRCYTDPYYFKSELYKNEIEGCEILSKYIPNGSTREHVEKILIESDGARIQEGNPNTKGPTIGSVIYNLDPWVIFANDAAYIYVWYENGHLIGFAGTGCGFDRLPPKQKEIYDNIMKGRQ